MAQKSKTQRAKASANRAAKKEQARIAEEQGLDKASQEEVVEEQPKKTRLGGFLSSKEKFEDKSASTKKSASKKEDKPKKRNKLVQFFVDVKAEMKRVTWPTKQDVLRWSGVVVGALLFFGIFVALLDNAIITPILVALSGLGA